MYVATIAAYSDLHIEHSSVVLSATADVIVLAGDIYALGPAYMEEPSVIHWIDQTFPDKDVVFVPGNHDLENSYWERQMRVWCAHAQQLGGRIHVLWNESVILHGVQFLGTPLFSNFSSTNNSQEAIKAAKGVPDFNRIWHLSGKCVTPEDYIQWHSAYKS